MNEGNTVKTYEYRVLNYAPTPLAEAGPPCLVVVEEFCLDAPNEIRIYIPLLWSEEIAPPHVEYILRLAREWDHLPVSEETTRWLDSLQELSVGPLRLGDLGVCEEQDLPKVLDSIFNGAWHSAP